MLHAENAHRMVSTYATMSVLSPDSERTTGDPKPEEASIVGGIRIVKDMLRDLQQMGIRPGTKLFITIEEVPEEEQKAEER